MKKQNNCENGHLLYKISLDNGCYKCANCNIMYIKNHNNDEYYIVNSSEKKK